jgi:hypothetical protein
MVAEPGYPIFNRCGTGGARQMARSSGSLHCRGDQPIARPDFHTPAVVLPHCCVGVSDGLGVTVKREIVHADQLAVRVDQAEAIRCHGTTTEAAAPDGRKPRIGAGLVSVVVGGGNMELGGDHIAER